MGDLAPVRELPYGPAAERCIKAGQMTASDYPPHPPKTACTFRGVHRWKADAKKTSGAFALQLQTWTTNLEDIELFGVVDDFPKVAVGITKIA